MKEPMLGMIVVGVFIICNIVLRKVTQGRACRVYNIAREAQASVTASPVKTWIDDNRTHWRGDNRHRAVYQYEVDGQTYKKTMDYEGGVITLYYDPEKPKYAVTEGEARGGDHAVVIFIISLIITIIIANILKYIFA
ncbi:MAG: hypothetical protein J6J42_12080 [Lachnospiraceae bacterium]|nr:hypothetical protein [Lachnospiraceae bacterium]MBP3611057.1 hypothetical protein [Lachnospiraceae bacterium]